MWKKFDEERTKGTRAGSKKVVTSFQPPCTEPLMSVFKQSVRKLEIAFRLKRGSQSGTHRRFTSCFIMPSTSRHKASIVHLYPTLPQLLDRALPPLPLLPLLPLLLPPQARIQTQLQLQLQL